jgi:hypothetical protein
VNTWVTDRLPTLVDADPLGYVRWGPNYPGMLLLWDDVRLGEAWKHSSAWNHGNEFLPPEPSVDV